MSAQWLMAFQPGFDAASFVIAAALATVVICKMDFDPGDMGGMVA